MVESLLTHGLVTCTPRHAAAPAPPPSPVTPGRPEVPPLDLAAVDRVPPKVPPLDLAAVVALGGRPARGPAATPKAARWTGPRLQEEGIDEDHLYEEAEAVRLLSPQGTLGCAASSEHLRLGLHPLEKKVKAPLATESLLFHGLVVDHTKPAARPTSKHRGAHDGYRKEVRSGSTATPTTMASEAGAEAR